MAGTRRALPSWMSGRENKGREKEPLKSKKKRKATRTAFYCMNEQELVEAAAAVVTACVGAVPPAGQKDQNTGGEEAAAQTRPRLTCAAKESAEESGEMTYVSESDLDITEVETLPYAGSSLPQRPGGQRSEAGQESKSASGADAGPRAERGGARPQTPEDTDKDDALQLVREIFFN